MNCAKFRVDGLSDVHLRTRKSKDIDRIIGRGKWMDSFIFVLCTCEEIDELDPSLIIRIKTLIPFFDGRSKHLCVDDDEEADWLLFYGYR